MDSTSPHPDWFTPAPDGPHEASRGWAADNYTVVSFCRKDGERWPCATERHRQREDEGRGD
ncbi:MAG TPA: hypothetical protein VE172_09310 [Stackebrandtia sp.]|jgi:hypothetical protein|uniref:hypothetical protein n=1 Tax=Stackebrandtia sp. TaxID=2023065 RepID=UPI002D386527|nr:hypothetical protein [Stackebrandtia sp.]HZE38994.1 hypothetical protein [Stackebrandtia sp.]